MQSPWNKEAIGGRLTFSASPDSFLSPKLHSPHTAKSCQLCLQTRREPGPRSPPHRRHPPRSPSSLACDCSGLPASALAGFAHTSAIVRSRHSLLRALRRALHLTATETQTLTRAPRPRQAGLRGREGLPGRPAGPAARPIISPPLAGLLRVSSPPSLLKAGLPPTARPPWHPRRGAQHRLALVSLAVAWLPPPGRALGEGRSLCWLQCPRRANSARHSAGAEGRCGTPPGGQGAPTL